MECAVSGGNKLISGRNLDSNFRKINFPIIQINIIIVIILTLIFIAKGTFSYLPVKIFNILENNMFK